MKKEKNILILTMILNLGIASIKLGVGILFGFSTLVADSLHSFSDFLTDIFSTIASRIGRKRANKKYPFGYGLIENIANLFIGMILLSLGIFILIEAFSSKEAIISLEIFITLFIVIILKLIVICLLKIYGKKWNSSTLLLSAKESFTDFFSSIIVLVVSILLLFKDIFPILRYADIVGSILISIIVFIVSFQVIFDNVRYLIGINIEDDDLNNQIKEVLDTFKKIKSYKIKLLKMGNYYNLYLEISLENNITLRQLFNLEKKIKKELKDLKQNVKFIEIEPKSLKA